MKKKRNIFIFAVFLILLVIMIFIGEKSEAVFLNYVMTDIDGVTVYTIEDTSFIETSEETDLIKIDVKDKGIIIAELYPLIAPITVVNFKKLVNEKYYDNIIFHRVIEDFMIQTGDPEGTGYGGSEDTIKGEFSENGVENNLLHERGVLSMARKGADPDTDETRNSASSQFFIVQRNSTHLDGKYAAFGRVVSGLDLVDEIAGISVNESYKPIKDVVMNGIRFVKVYEGDVEY